jgi:hypothetical protein
MFSVNNKLILEPYVKEALKAKVQGGIAIPGQRDGVKGLRLLVNAMLNDGKSIPKGSIVYIKEEALHNHSWASKVNTCDAFSDKFMTADYSFVEFIVTPDQEV